MRAVTHKDCVSRDPLLYERPEVGTLGSEGGFAVAWGEQNGVGCLWEAGQEGGGRGRTSPLYFIPFYDVSTVSTPWMVTLCKKLCNLKQKLKCNSN